MNYTNSPYFSEIYKIIKFILHEDNNMISFISIEIVKEILLYLGYKGEIILSSSLPVNSKGSDLVLDLCKFMGVKEGTQLARTEVTKYIIQYIKDNDLPDKSNKKIIKPNTKLKRLLSIEKNDEVTYFNLQKYMNDL